MAQTLPDETLRKILHQIQEGAQVADRNLNIAKTQIGSRERERRVLQLTIAEITGLGPDVNVYRGVGKMFLQVPKPTMENELKKQEKDLTDDIDALKKKEKFLEKQFNEAQGRLRDIFHSSTRR